MHVVAEVGKLGPSLFDNLKGVCDAMSDRPLSPFALEVLRVLKNECDNFTGTTTAEHVFDVIWAAKIGNRRGLCLENVYQALEALRCRGLCEEVEIRPEHWKWRFIKFPDKPKAPTDEQGRLF